MSSFGVQRAASILSRASIQTAVVMSTGLGTGQRSAKNYRHAARELQLGALRLEPRILDMQLVELYESETNSEHKKQFNDQMGPQNPQSNLPCIDLVLTPIDGAGALKTGESGSVSVAAAALSDITKKPFCNPCNDATGFLVIALGPEETKSFGVDKVEIEAETLFQLQVEFPLLRRILLPHQSRHALGVMFDAYPKFFPKLSDMQSIRRLQGSAVAAALAAFCGKLPYSVFFARLPQVIQASVAAKGLKCRLYAIPLYDPTDRLVSNRDTDTPKTLENVHVVAGEAFTESKFVNTNDAVVTCTSISEVCVLDRVRFASDGTAEANTLTVSLVKDGNGSTTRQIDCVPPNWSMRSPEGKDVEGRYLIEAYRRYLPIGSQDTSVQLELEKLRCESGGQSI